MVFKVVINVILVSLILVFSSSFASAETQVLNEFQKETITSIREITLQLILIAMAVFALLGAFATSSERTFRIQPLIWIAFSFLGASVVTGLFAYGNLIWSLGKGHFEPFGILETLGMWQWIFFGIGGLVFGLFVLLNIRPNKRQ